MLNEIVHLNFYLLKIEIEVIFENWKISKYLNISINEIYLPLSIVFTNLNLYEFHKIHFLF